MSGRTSSPAPGFGRPNPAPLTTSWRSVPYCVLDLETTGLDPRHDEIVSYATVPIDGGRIVARGIRHGLIRPARAISRESACIHGIRPQDVASAPTLDDALNDLLVALSGRILVVHVDWVERGFLARALRRRKVRLHEPILDTNRLAHAYIPGLPETVNLTSLATNLKLPVYGQHEALGDALTTAQVFLALATLLDRRSPQTLDSLRQAGSRRNTRDRLRDFVRA